MLNFKVDESLCTRCKECVRDCPSRVINLPDEGVPALTEEAETNCIRCQHCMAVCPTAAISILGRNPADSIPLNPDSLPELNSVELLVKGRRTTRRYKDEDVAPDLIQQLLESAACAPTGANRRALKFTVIDNRETMKQIRQTVMEALGTAAENKAIPEHFAYLHAAVPAFFKHKSDLIFRGAPHLLLVSAGKDALCPTEDIPIALSAFEYLASAAGLGTTWCGMLKMALECLPELKSTFRLPADDNYYSMLFGTPDVKYHRTVQREHSAKMEKLTAS